MTTTESTQSTIATPLRAANGPPSAAAIPTLASANLDVIMAETERRKLALEPQDLDQSWWLCETIARLNLHGVKTPEDALARVMTGRTLGLPAMQSIEQIHLLWNKSSETWTTVMSVKAKLALVYRRKDVVEYIRPTKLTDTEATWVAKRRGEGEVEQTYTFTIGMAETAGLVGRGKDEAAKAAGNYSKHPGVMLQWRACGRLCDIIAADVLLGIATAEELEDSDDYAQRQAEQIRQVAEEVVDRVQAKRSLDDKLAARETPAAPAPVTARDWQAEASVLKTKITEAIASNDAASKKAVQAEYKAFEKGAPPEVTADLLAFYNVARGKKSVDKKPAPGDPNPEAPPADATGPAAASTAGPAATPPVAQTAPAKAAQTAPAGPACVQCGEAIPEGQTPKWVPTANGGLGGFRHQECQPKAAPMPTGQPAHGFGGPRPVAEPADAEPPPHVKTVGSDHYLPPHERGDAYDGPEEPPIPFGSP